MQSDNEGNLLEIIDLANTLRQEQLFIQHEQAAFENLNETLTKNSLLIAELAWICAQLRQNLNDLIISRPDAGPSLCCQRASRLENAKFVNAYKSKGLKYQHILSYNELFHYLYHSPYLLAQSLAAGDRISKMSVDQMNSIVHTITTGLYGNVIHSKDVEMILKLLRELIEIQIVVDDNPRRMLRIGSSAFARLYNRLTESLFSAKIFLTAALHAPVMKVLTESESTLDIDPNKALTALSTKERLRRFGPENIPEYNENIQKYRDDTINQLFEFTNEFIDNLIKNWSLFPSTLRWLVQTMCHQLKQAHINDKDINEIITDMVFTYYICPALVSPDLYGITDAPISEIARFNLIQIGQIIQMLALVKYEDVEQQKFNDVCKKFNRNVVANLLEQLLINDSDVDVGGVDVVAIRSQQSDFERAQVLLTQTELSVFVDFLRTVLDYDELIISGDERRKLGKILDHLPDKFETIVNGGGGDITLNSSSTSSAQQNFIITSSILSSSSQHQHQQQQQQLEQQNQNSGSSGNRTKQSLINLGKTTKNKIAKTMSLNITTHTNFETDDIIFTSTTMAASANNAVGGTNGTTTTNLSNNNYSHHNGGGVNNFHSSPSRNNHHNQNSINSNSAQNHFSAMYDDIEQVLLFPISIADDNKMKLLTEEEVLKMNSIGQQDIVVNPSLIEENIEKLDKVDAVGFDVLNPVLRPVQTKTTRFSLSHDDASIGNSDNLEAVSEAPSNHSVTSSLELEENDQNDNLSDMVSANVSGRGTPNISGRDTPSSQVTEGENLSNQIPTPQMAKIINKARSDIEDKFCKFEIKKLIEGDETISIISDTWSTDVLASDSEILDSNEKDRNFSTPLIPSAVVLPGDSNFDVLTGSSRSRATGNYLDASETRSESAWSTDVLASDSEKLAEVDTDDNASITAKSDTTDAGRFEGEREQENSASSSVNQNRTPDSPFFAPRSTNQNFRTPDSPMYAPRNAEFFAQSSSYDETLARDRYSSLARSSTRTTNQYTGENSFQQNYKSTVDRSSFLTANNSRMRRQNSAESSISNQSLSLDDCYGMKTKQEANTEFRRKSSKDLIDFSDFQEDGASGGTNKTENVDGNDDLEACYRGFSEESVIHRRISSEQRNASFDGRRNGMMEFKAGDSAKNNQRRHQSLNYENHDIIINKTTQRVVSVPNPETSLTDDVKTQQNLIDEMLLIQKAEELSLNNNDNNNSNTNSITTNCETVVEVTETQNSPNTIQKPSRSTGAIPKSISFDSSADKSDRNISISRRINDPIRVNGSGFFHKIKQGFRNRRGNKNRLSHDDFSTTTTTTTRNVSFSGNTELETTSGNNIGNRGGGENGFSDMTEDILAKYRRKVSTSSETTNSDSTGGSCSAANHKNSDIEPRLTNGVLPDKAMAFINAKRKIRTVLSSTDLHTGDFRHTTFPNISPLLTYLQIQLAQAINLQNFQQISYVSEAIRCLNSLDFLQHHKLIKELQDDIIKRQSYLQYLMRYRQNLLSIIENIDQFEERLRNERDQCNRHLLSVCIRMFLEKREKLIEEFHTEFNNLTVVDEKIDFLEEFMIKLMNELKIDGILCGMADWQLEEARISIERNLLQRLYKQIMFPNDDVDISRDKVLHEHIYKLQRIITPSHTALRIPQEYLSEAPWPFAQQQISYISAYTTPREKLLCVVRCIQSIMNLLQMACDRVPAADDLLPVLIYVLIKANPPYLLSTIQYVNCFIGDKLDGQDQFHWTQFCSVVQFIKTMDYLD